MRKEEGVRTTEKTEGKQGARGSGTVLGREGTFQGTGGGRGQLIQGERVKGEEVESGLLKNSSARVPGWLSR